MGTGRIGPASASAGAGAGAGAGIGAESNRDQGRVTSDRVLPASTIPEADPADSNVGYLVNIPFYYEGAGETGEVESAVSYIYDSILGNSTFKTGRNFKVLIGLNRKKDVSSSNSFDLVQGRLREMVIDRGERVVDYALACYEWSPIKDRPVDGGVNYTDLRNFLFKDERNDAFYEAFKREGVSQIYYLAMDPDTKLDTDVFGSIESSFLSEQTPVIIAGHYQFTVEKTKLIQADGSYNWPGFLASIHTEYDQALKKDLAQTKILKSDNRLQDCLKEISHEDYIGVSKNIRVLLHILNNHSLTPSEEELCKKCLTLHQTLERHQRSVEQSTLLCRSYLTQLVEIVDNESFGHFKEILYRLPKPNKWEPLEESSSENDPPKHKLKSFRWNYTELMECMCGLSNRKNYHFFSTGNRLVNRIRDESQLVIDDLNTILNLTHQVRTSRLNLSPELRSVKAPIEIVGSEILSPPSSAVFIKLYQNLNRLLDIPAARIPVVVAARAHAAANRSNIIADSDRDRTAAIANRVAIIDAVGARVRNDADVSAIRTAVVAAARAHAAANCSNVIATRDRDRTAVITAVATRAVDRAAIIDAVAVRARAAAAVSAAVAADKRAHIAAVVAAHATARTARARAAAAAGDVAAAYAAYDDAPLYPDTTYDGVDIPAVVVADHATDSAVRARVAAHAGNVAATYAAVDAPLYPVANSSNLIAACDRANADCSAADAAARAAVSAAVSDIATDDRARVAYAAAETAARATARAATASSSATVVAYAAAEAAVDIPSFAAANAVAIATGAASTAAAAAFSSAVDAVDAVRAAADAADAAGSIAGYPTVTTIIDRAGVACRAADAYRNAADAIFRSAAVDTALGRVRNYSAATATAAAAAAAATAVAVRSADAAAVYAATARHATMITARTAAAARSVAAYRTAAAAAAAYRAYVAMIAYYSASNLQGEIDFFEFLRTKKISIWGGKGSNHTDEGEALCATLKRAWGEFQLTLSKSSPFSIQFGFDYYTEAPDRVFKSLSPGNDINTLLDALITDLKEVKANSGDDDDAQEQVAEAFNEKSKSLVDALMTLQEKMTQSSIKESFLAQRGRYIAQISKHEGGYKEGLVPLEYANDVYGILQKDYKLFRDKKLELIRARLLTFLGDEILELVLNN